MFDDVELAYLRSQRLARLATVAPDGQPDNSPVAFEFDGRHFWVGGRDLAATRTYRNITGGNHRVALVIDDLESTEPWQPRGVRVYGTAEAVERQGRFGRAPYLRITPTVSWSWALEVAPDDDEGRATTTRTVW